MRKSFPPRASCLGAIWMPFNLGHRRLIEAGQSEVCQVVGGRPRPPPASSATKLAASCASRASFEAEFNLIPLDRSPETGGGHCIASNWFGSSQLTRNGWAEAPWSRLTHIAHTRAAVSAVQQSSNLMAPRRGFSRDGAAGKLMLSWQADLLDGEPA